MLYDVMLDSSSFDYHLIYIFVSYIYIYLRNMASMMGQKSGKKKETKGNPGTGYLSPDKYHGVRIFYIFHISKNPFYYLLSSLTPFTLYYKHNIGSK